MKKKSKLIAAVFALILGVSTVMPGMQAQASKMHNFTPQNMSSYSTKLTAGLQTFLLNYSKDTKDYIRDNGMIDGQYGPATRDAVKLFQRDQHLEKDGKCGKNTWSRIEWFVMNSLFKTKGNWNFYELPATYYNSGNSLAYCPSKDLWRGYYEGSGSISNIKLGWHDIG